jgi:hypothetical protein
MKITLLTASAFAVALAMPLGVSAQQNQYPSQNQYPGQNQYPSQNQYRVQSRGATPSSARMHQRWTRRFGRLNLSGDQQQRIQSLIDRYSQAHPEGSPRDPASMRDLRRQIMGQLSGDQLNQFRAIRSAERAQLRQRRAQMQQQGGAQQYPGQYRGQQAPQQYQGAPQQYQGAPQQYQGAPQQYQGAPQQDQGAPQEPPAAPPA